MGEPGNAGEFILMYGVNPFTKEPEIIKSSYEKYTLDSKTGMSVPKENKK